MGEVAEEVIERTEPFNSDDWELFVTAICDALFETIHTYASDTEDEAGWTVVLDPENAPIEALPWLAQFVGSRLSDSMTEAEQRLAIELPEGFRRGSLPALRAAVERTLTGAKTVLIDERYTGSAYQLRVRTLESETPSDATSIAAILTQKPVGVVLTFESIVGGDWDDLVADFSAWTDVVAAEDTWEDVTARLP